MEEQEQGLYYPDGSFKSITQIEEDTFDQEQELENKLTKEKNQTVEELSEKLGIGIGIIKDTVDSMKEKGYGIFVDGNQFIRSKTEAPRDGVNIELGKNFKIGIVSDPHLTSKKERLDELHNMYDIFEAEGITKVFNAGDMTEGHGVYRGQEFELKKFGQNEQIDYAVENYPKRKGITTYFITGNHDLREYERGGVDVGVVIASRREDLIYLGQAYSEIRTSDGTHIEMLHPAGGVAYALSYKAQKFINNLSPEDVPDMMIWGHYHTAFYMHYRNVHFIQAPCFKDAGVWEKRLGLNPTVGGWIVEGKIGDEGKIQRFRSELFEFMKSRE